MLVNGNSKNIRGFEQRTNAGQALPGNRAARLVSHRGNSQHRYALFLQRSTGARFALLPAIVANGRLQCRVVQQFGPVLFLRPSVRSHHLLLREGPWFSHQWDDRRRLVQHLSRGNCKIYFILQQIFIICTKYIVERKCLVVFYNLYSNISNNNNKLLGFVLLYHSAWGTW